MRSLKKTDLGLVVGLMLFAFFLYRFDAVIGLIQALITIISPFIIGAVLALVINLPMRFFERLFTLRQHGVLAKLRRGISLTLSVILVLAVVVMLMVFIIPEVIVAVERLIAVVPSLLGDLEEWLSHSNMQIRNSLGLAETDESGVRDLFQRAYQFLIGGLSSSSGMVISAAQFVLNVGIGLVFAIYLLFSKERIRAQLSRLLTALLPPKADAFVQHILHLLLKAYSNFIGGQLLQSILSSALTMAALAVFGFPYAVLIGLITFVASFIPIFGPYISGILGLLLVFTADPGQAGWFLLAFLLVQQLVGSVVYPRIMSGAIAIPSIWVLVAVTLGGGMFGIAGMLLFIPLAAVIYRLTAEHVRRREHRRAEKEQHIDSV
ncbi:MAG: AI-2E family transporter [Eubacteriales bacterium]|jgi:predicted PurR-regulated permease PerM|nr:AI-2E family transporter [Eubacteriales bacterium]